MYKISLLFMQFLIFSMLGYVAEMITCCVVNKKLTNRGFLCGPVIPIYGFGCLSMLLVLQPYKENPFLIFILAVLLTTSLEYLTSYLLEKIFHNKWWDYSYLKYNINGRICLRNAILFGIGGLIIIYLVGPWVVNFLSHFKKGVLIVLSIIFFILFLLDTVYSAIVAYSLRNRLIIVEDLKNDKLAKIPGILEKVLARRIKNFKGLKLYPSRLLKAFPYIGKSNEKEFDLMKKIALKEKEIKRKIKLDKKKKKRKKKKKKK